MSAAESGNKRPRVRDSQLNQLYVDDHNTVNSISVSNSNNADNDAASSNKGKKRKRSSSFLKKVETNLRKISDTGAMLHQKFTHDVIDPYCTVSLSTTNKTRTTKPVRDGGANTVWSSEHNNVLSFQYSFDEEEKSPNRAVDEQLKFDDDKGSLYFDVFDQDIIMDAHIGGNHVRLAELLKKLITPDMSKQSPIKEQPLEIPLYRKMDGSVSGFLRARIRFEMHGKRLSYDADTGLPTSKNIYGELFVTIESGSDLWDPNSEEEWIPTDAHQGRSLGLSFAICVTYFIGGSLLFVFIEGWNFWDAMYFGAATFTTVGYGSPAPVTPAGRLAACVFMIFGVTMVSVSIIRLWLAAVGVIAPACMTCGKLVKDETVVVCCNKKNRKNPESSAAVRPELIAARRGSVHAGWQDAEFKAARNVDDADDDDDDDYNDSFSSKEYLQPDSLLFVSVVAAFKLLVLVLFGTIFFMLFPGEDLTFTESIYMSTATVMTVGYGDLSPQTQTGKIFATIWMTFSYAVLLRALQDVTNTVHAQSLHKMRTQLLNRDLSRTAILNMDKDGDGLLSRLEFLSHMVVALKLCTPQHLKAIMQRFDEVEHSREARTMVMNEMENLRELNFQIRKESAKLHNRDWDTAAHFGVEHHKRTTTVLVETVHGAQILEEEHLKIQQTLRNNSPKNQKRIIRKSTALKEMSGMKKNTRSSNTIPVDIDLVRTSAATLENNDLSLSGSRRITRNSTLRGMVGDGTSGEPAQLEMKPKVIVQTNTKIFPMLIPYNKKSIDSKKKSNQQEMEENQQQQEQQNWKQQQLMQNRIEKQPDSPSTSSVGSSNSQDVEDDIAPENRDNTLSTMLAYMRRARDASRKYVQEHAESAKLEGSVDKEKARLAFIAYRDLLEALHRQQNYAHDLLSSHDPEVLRLQEMKGKS